MRDVLQPSVAPATGGVSIHGGTVGSDIQSYTRNGGAAGTVTLNHADVLRNYTAHGLIYGERDTADTLTCTQHADTMFGGGGERHPPWQRR